MSYMFRGCSSLKSLDLSNFNTPNVERMGYMLSDCSSLESLDLSNFNTPNVIEMDYMFSGCSSLKSLDLSNFNTTKVENMENVFANCSSLQFVNLSDYYGNDIFDAISDYTILKICINDYNQINMGNNTLKNENVTIDCTKDTPSNKPNNSIIYLGMLASLAAFAMVILYIIKLIF